MRDRKDWMRNLGNGERMSGRVEVSANENDCKMVKEYDE